jgi:uncharacterized lipoprotein YmbA
MRVLRNSTLARAAAVSGFVAVGGGLAAVTCGLSACVSLKRTPEARFFVLRSLVEPPASATPERPAGIVGVLPTRLPGHLERPQVVTWKAPGELRVDEFLRWAEPIDAGVTRTLVENLDALLPEYPVLSSPWPASVVPRCRVRVELRVFGPQPNGEVRLEGRFLVLPGKRERPYVLRSTSLRRGPFPNGAAPPDAGVGVEAMSELLADLAREIGAVVRALPAEGDEKKG